MARQTYSADWSPHVQPQIFYGRLVIGDTGVPGRKKVREYDLDVHLFQGRQQLVPSGVVTQPDASRPVVLHPRRAGPGEHPAENLSPFTFSASGR